MRLQQRLAVGVVLPGEPVVVPRRAIELHDEPALPPEEVGIDFARMVHGGQEFRWGPVVVAGDEITTTASLKDVSERRGNGFFVFESVSVNGRGETVCTGLWSNIVRAA